jgi:hypothetical protein
VLSTVTTGATAGVVCVAWWACRDGYAVGVLSALSFLIRLLLAFVLAVLVVPWCWHILVVQWHDRIAYPYGPLPEDLWSVVVGTISSFLLMLWKRPNWFIHTSIHEFAHLLMCIVLFVPVHGFRASANAGGEVTHTRPDPIREVLILIAPYVIPMLLIPCLVAVQLTRPGPWRCLASGFAAFTYVQYLQSLYHNVRNNFAGSEGDLAKVGRPLSLVLIASALLLVTAWVIGMLWM